ncbi:hypothetical protein [Burkholderia pseudomallei]|uniref:hypothetical protein n=1 Tax=Burkholderia pseudomallei TaxID=28450 RepID=UPI0012F50861|nr:hypothetical protein [Burkholderia pseudomallei]
MSQYVGIEPKQYPFTHCSPEVYVEAAAPTITPEQMEALAKSQRETAHRRPNPANGAPKPKGYNPVA